MNFNYGKYNTGEYLWNEHAHSQPDEDSWWPSGFDGYLIDNKPILKNPFPMGDVANFPISKSNQAYVFSKYLYNLNIGGGYINYTDSNATFTGNKLK